jgi:hypothetical protein
MGKKKNPSILLTDIQTHVCLSKTAAAISEAAAVVLFDCHHTDSASFSIRNGEERKSVDLKWYKPPPEAIAAHANAKDATEDGAYACAIAGAHHLFGLYAVGRAQQGSGADYMLSDRNELPEDFEDCIRLEVSGTRGKRSEVTTRLKTKIQQLKKGASILPGIAAIVGFEVCQMQFEHVEEEA